MADFQKIQDDIHQWSNETFPVEKFQSGFRLCGLAQHLIEESAEVRYEVNKLVNYNLSSDSKILQKEAILSQCADNQIILLDLIAKLGFTMEDLHNAIINKMNVNKSRTWEGPDKNGMYHHKK
jgi:hypothetical protein